MTLSVLPVNNDFNQTFEVSLPIDSKNRKLKFFFSWNPVGEYWQFDLYDQNDGGKQLLSNKVICPIDFPMNNILLTYEYKEIGSLYVVNIGKDTSDRPSPKGFSTSWVLVWGDTPYV